MKAIVSLISLLFAASVFAQVPIAQFSASPLQVCVGSNVNFTNQSSANGGPAIVQYAWDFGDGFSSTQQNPSHAYAAAGTYTITLVVTNSNGQADPEVKTNYITVNPNPVSQFTTSGNGCTVPFSVSFTNTSTGGSNLTYNWNFGNGQTSTQQTPAAVTYNTAGNYTVTLTVTNPSTGCTNTSTKTIVVSNFTAGINAPATACVGQPVSLADNSTTGANNWNWVFGNGQSSTQQNPSVTYNSPGTYTITLTAQNTGSGCASTTTQQITVNPLPTPSFTATPLTGCAPQVVNFTNTSGNGTFVWYFGDGTSYSGQTPPPHTYSSLGSYDVTLSMTSPGGCSNTVTLYSLINLTAPTVDFVANDTSGCAPLPVQFSESSVSPNPGADPISNWHWDFGDGTTFDGQTPPVHSFDLGVYDITLTVTTQNGCTNTLTLPEYIQVGQVDLVDFSWTPQVSCAKNNITFTNESVINTPHDPNEVEYFWNFGDGGTSTAENPNYQYAVDTGYFNVQLIVTWRGCSDTLIEPNAVYIKAPIAKFAPSTTLICNPSSLPVNIAVTDQAIHGETSDDIEMIWRWGDNTNYFMDDPQLDDANKGDTSHNYSTYGTYTIRQVIYNNTTGCSDSITQTVYISRTLANFTIPNDSICKNGTLQLTSTSTSTHPPLTYNYIMGNGANITSGPDPTYTYPTSGTFPITLIATNAVGCTGTSPVQSIKVLELPQAALSASQTAGCAPLTVVFTNQSSPQGNGVPLDTFNWTFNDDNTTQTTSTIGATVSHTYTTQGSFSTTLVATDQFGCVSAPAYANVLITKPTVDFTVDSVVCDLEQFTTSNASTGAGNLSYEWLVDQSSVSTSQNYSGSFDETNSPGYTFVPHIIQLIVTDENGCIDSLSQPINVSMPYPQIGYDLDGANVNAAGEFTCPPVFAGFTDNSNSYGDLTNWAWNFGDGKSSTLQDPDNTYVFPGTYSASLTITDEFGCTADTALIDFLTIFGPTAEPVYSQFGSLCAQEVTFTLTNAQNVTGVTWNFGDGNTSSDSAIVTHVYESINTFTPTATIFDSLGCAVIYPMDPIVIPDNGLDAYFVPNQTVGGLAFSFLFDDQSAFITPIVAWDWTYGNGNFDNNTTDADGFQQYYTAGNYTITLTVTDANGCKDKYSIVIEVTNQFEIPNVLTMNGDGVNDVFSIKADIFKSFNIIIQNRWGNVIHQGTNVTGTVLWDGLTDQGEDCTEGTYFYQLEGVLKDGNPFTKAGFVTKIK